MASAVLLEPDHRHAAGRHFDGDLDHAAVLGVTQRGRFPGGADRHQSVRALLYLPLHEFGERPLVDGAVRAHRRNQCDIGSPEHKPVTPVALRASCAAEMMKGPKG